MKNDYKFSNLVIIGMLIIIMIALILALYIVKPSKEEPVTDTLKKNNEDGIYNVLLLGRDNAAGLCDVIILASINTNSGDVCFMKIPRYTYLNYNDSTYKKINGVYNFFGSALSTSNAIAESLGIKIDFYISVDHSAVEQIVDAVGGIEVNIPMDMEYNDPAQNLSIKLKEGKQILDGKSAVEFLRYRAGYLTGDLGRIDAQKLFLHAFSKKVAKVGNPFALYNLFKLVFEKAETNIKEKDIVSIGLKCFKAKGGAVSYVTAPGEAIQSEKSGAWYYILSNPSMNELLSSHFDGSANFDKENKFVDKNTKSFYDVYNKKCDIKIYTAEDVENNKININ